MQQILHGHIFGFWPHTTKYGFLVNQLRTNSEQTPSELRTPNELRMNSEQTPSKLRTNSERTPNELRASSEQTPNKRTSSEQALSLVHFRTNPRANSEHTLAISMFLSLSILVVKPCLFVFFGLTKRGQVITGASFNKWPGKAFRAEFVGLQSCGGLKPLPGDHAAWLTLRLAVEAETKLNLFDQGLIRGGKNTTYSQKKSLSSTPVLNLRVCPICVMACPILVV